MLTAYIQAAMSRAQYEMIEDPNPFFGHIPECDGVMAAGRTLDECRRELQEALEIWLLYSLTHEMPVPVIDGIELTLKEAA